MNENIENQNSDAKDSKINPFSFVAVLLYYPALGTAIRLGISSYFFLFDNLTGLSVIFGIIITILITVIFVIMALGIVHLLIQLGDKLYNLISNKKSSESQKLK